jgi:hypothetical protein
MLSAGYFLSGDQDHSVYTEAAYEIVRGDDLSARMIIGAGNGLHVVKDNFKMVHTGVTVNKGPMFVSYTVNTDIKTRYLVFGYGF